MEEDMVDIACIRSFPQNELLQRAKVHMTKCVLMGHCMESGYGLMNATGSLSILDSKVTPKVVEVLQVSTTENGAYLRMERKCKEENGCLQCTGTAH